MQILLQKGKEVLRTLLPVMVLVILLCSTVVTVSAAIFIRFLIGSLLLLVGLAVFLWGIETSMHTIGGLMAKELATRKSLSSILILGFLLGFLITVAEPDLLILGSQVETASGGGLSAAFIVYVVSTGVGLTVAFGLLRQLKGKPRYATYMAILYGFILVMALFAAEEFLAIAVDSSGATTGALTTPFALAITLGLSTLIGGKESEEHAFGLVGVMSAGPILAILAVSIFGRYSSLSAVAFDMTQSEGIIAPLLAVAPGCLKDSLLALIPIATLFFLYNAFRFKLPWGELRSIIAGLFLTLTGLVLFLTGVHAGFLEMGRIIGMQVAAQSPVLLIAVGFFIGMIVVLMEPAVHVLGQQIETVTAGHIPIKLIRATLSGGVALAIALSMVRILVPSVHLPYFLIPGFLIAVILSFFSEPIFVAIAYDAGGVASGPMTATFVLAFAQGAALMIPTADVMSDGFGVIAMVAMAPVLSLNLLGVVFRYRRLKAERPLERTKSAELPIAAQLCVAVTVPRGSADQVVRLAREHGAAGATILLARGGAFARAFTLPLSSVSVMPEQEIVVMVLAYSTAQAVQSAIEEAEELNAQISSLPATGMIKSYEDQLSEERK